MSSDARLIPLRIANKTAYVWDVDDIATIRSKYRICGVLTGTLPHLSQQNVFLGAPLVLLPEEAALLVDIGVAVLVDDPTAYKQSTVPQLERWSAVQQESIKTQLSYNETKVAKESNSGRAMSEDAMRKRKEREERKRAQAVAKAAEEGDSSAPASSVFMRSEPEVKLPPSTDHIPPTDTSKTSSIPYTIVIPASSSSLEWYDVSDCSYSTIESAREAGVWEYPSNLAERARRGVFKDLWKQGYFMGVGIKFGGEYLVYPGDPLRYHSHFTASVLESPIASLRPMEIVAHGRLGTATKKAHLLCGWDDEKKEVSYLSIEWAGFG
ncbi:hypothetical protein BDN70DRAFT_839450 [Pholiota conissans]|uniref:tRNA-splicing endonuclease subunit Sen34 n=1 Tax=Pholiota conissans TaxID=109636 RepID=A0A9P5YVQ3_9AGAR|nr:hypothetical protein BDN70DRAFT_839450 [Pholiota conissans]